MEEVAKKKKLIELIALKHDPFYKLYKKALKIVIEFIREHNLILYGGTAIDYALRLEGSQIYDDKLLKVPDLDFYSFKHAEHAYKLADILYEAGYERARAIVATHVTTMRVDMGDNHWVADISYVPQEIYDNVRCLNYQGLRIVHPDVQRLDLHNALCTPFDNPPREVIFDRWKKDVERFNLFCKYYPFAADSTSSFALKPVDVKTLDVDTVYTGYIAYMILKTDISKKANTKLQTYKIEYITDNLQDPKVIQDSQGAEKVRIYRPYFNYLPMCAEYGDKIAYCTHDALISTVKVGKFTVAAVHHIAKMLLAHACINPPGKARNTYAAAYVDLLNLMDKYRDKQQFQLSIDVYGSSNVSLSMKRSRANMEARRVATDPATPLEIVGIPKNYRAATKEWPAVTLSEDMFKDDGTEVVP